LPQQCEQAAAGHGAQQIDSHSQKRERHPGAANAGAINGTCATDASTANPGGMKTATTADSGAATSCSRRVGCRKRDSNGWCRRLSLGVKPNGPPVRIECLSSDSKIIVSSFLVAVVDGYYLSDSMLF
jgi:hypothetical protein